MIKYDYIIAGGGAAGLSLAYQLVQSTLRDRRILIIDRDEKRKNDRTWCFWTTRPTHYNAVYYRSWKKIRVISDDFSRTFDLGDFQYNMVRGIDFYEFNRQELSVRPNVDFLTADIHQVLDGPGYASVAAGGETYSADWVFDSRFDPKELVPQPDRYHYLKQHFLGWEIETDEDLFDPSVPVLFDFRTNQESEMRFFYILPFTSRSALAEFTIFSADVLTREEYESRLCTYLKETLRIPSFTTHSVETGIIPMTDHPFRRRLGERILAIGTRGGLVKPSSGYAFLRIQQDSTAIVRSLERQGHPMDIPPRPARYRLFDSILLQVMYRQGVMSKPIFTRLFQKNPVNRVFNFLDESGSLWDDIQLITSLQPTPFLRALFRLKVLRTI
jgi:lycopene beta-cyclase